MREYNDDMIRDLLPDFVRGDLPEEMQQTVAARIATDPDLQAEADLLRAFLASVVAMDVSHADVARISLAISPYNPVRPAYNPAAHNNDGTVSQPSQPSQRSQRSQRSWGYRWVTSVGVIPIAATFAMVAIGITAVTMLKQEPSQFQEVSVADTHTSQADSPMTSDSPPDPIVEPVVVASDAPAERPTRGPVKGPARGPAPGVTLVGVNTLSDDDLVQLIHSLNDDVVEPVNGVESAVAVTWGGLI